MTRGGIGSHTKPFKGETDSWITPKEIVSALGSFDLDPCEHITQPWKLAASGISLPDDGLLREWFGRVWLNPPYSEAWRWLDRLAEHGDGIALVFARTEVAGFVRTVWNRASAVLFIYGRLTFCRPDGSRGRSNSGGPSCLVAYGSRNVAALKQSGIPGTLVVLDRAAREVAR